MYKILIVDDVNVNIKLAEIILAREKCYEVISANNGLAALKKVEECSPDLILLDAMMPDINGIEVAKKIRETHSNLDIPIIMITASTEYEIKIQALEAGIDEFLNKPIERVELVTRIRTLLKNKSLHNELLQRHTEIMHQMDLAKIVQAKLQSTGVFHYSDVTINSSYFPMFQIGGDMIFIKELTNGKIIVFIGDASGHGISAALVSTLVKAVLVGIPNVADSGQGMTYINDTLSKYFDANLDDMYVTCILNIIDPAKKKISITCGGHPLPMVRQKGEEAFHNLDLNCGPPIGIIGKIAYKSDEISYENLDEMLLYTDGLFPMIGYENISILEDGFTEDVLDGIIEKRGLMAVEEHEDDFAIIRLSFSKVDKILGVFE